jgi:penicillin-binding protein 1C
VDPPPPGFIVADILADPTPAPRTFGTDSVLRTRGWAAVKTGTSKDMRDNWCVGFTDRYTVGVWVGNASGAPMHDVSGISGAAPVWQALVQHLHRAAVAAGRRGGRARGVRRCTASHARRMVRRRHRAALGAMARSAASVAGITSPTDGAIYALDPDMPAAAQRITLRGRAGTWVLDGRVLGRGRQLQWAPRPGRHVLALRDERGRLLQQLGFEVRGLQAPMRPPSSRVITTVAERGRLPAP